MRLTEALIQKSPQVTNPLGERELDLRGVGLQHLDESVLTKIAEDFDVLNFSDNQISTLDAFPKMERVTTLMLHKNSMLTSVGAGVTLRTPNVHTFVANACGFYTLHSLKFLSGWKQLLRVSLSKCPVLDNLAQALFVANSSAGKSSTTSSSDNGTVSSATAPNIPSSLKGLSAPVVLRLYLIAICAPELKLIDFERVLDRERDQAKALRDDLLSLPRVLAVAGATNGQTNLSSVDENGTGASSQFNADGTRIRKRGRESKLATNTNTATNAPSASSAPLGTTVGSTTTADDLSTTVAEDEITEEELAARNAALEQRIENATTEEEFDQIKLEMELLESLQQKLEARKNAKKHRSERK